MRKSGAQLNPPSTGVVSTGWHPPAVNAASRPVRWAFALTAAALFLIISWSPNHYWDEFFYLFSAAAHTPRELVRFEPNQTIFPNGFFSGKIGHVVLLRLLLGGLGLGRLSLLIIQSLYAVLILAFAGAAWGLLRELLDRQGADRSALVLLFLPVTTYLGYKTLSEAPSLLFTAIGCWAFLRSFREKGTARLIMLLSLSALSLAVGTLCRVTGVISFVGLGLGLCAANDPRFRPLEVARRAAPVLAASLLFYALVLYGSGSSFSQLGSLAYQAASLPNAGMRRLYALALTLQAFVLVLPFGFRWQEQPVARLMAIWLALTALPSLALHEPRYYAPTLIPLAVLCGFGIRRVTDRLLGQNQRWAWVLVLGLLALMDRVAFSPLMPYEVNQNRLMTVIEQLKRTAPGGSYLVPWLSDWAFLRVVFPRDTTLLCITAMPGLRYTAEGRPGPMPPEDRWWAGAGHYVGSLSALGKEPHPWFYIGWTYSPSLMQLRQRLERLGIHWAEDPVRAGWHNHLAGSWVWGDRSLSLTPIDQEGQYHVFRVSTSRPSARPGPGA